MADDPRTPFAIGWWQPQVGEPLMAMFSVGDFCGPPGNFSGLKAIQMDLAEGYQIGFVVYDKVGNFKFAHFSTILCSTNLEHGDYIQAIEFRWLTVGKHQVFHLRRVGEIYQVQ